MSFDWSKFLDLANNLSGGDESSKRSAISRAYYAAFCSARDRLTKSGVYIPRTGEAHDRVPALYALSRDYDSQEISKALMREKIVRNSADYDCVFDGDLDDSAGRSLQRAEKTLKSVNNMPEVIIDEIKSKI